MPTTALIPDDVKTNAVADATAAAGSLLNSLVTTDEHGQVAAVINFTPFDFTLVDGFGRPDGSANADPEWEKAATGFSAYNMPAPDQNDGHMHRTNYTTFALGGRIGFGNTQYGGAFCFYSAKAHMNLFVAIGYSNFSAAGLRGGDHIGMAFFLDGSEIHGDLVAFTTKVRNALLDPKGSDHADLGRLGAGLGYSYGAPATARWAGMKVQFTGAKEMIFVVEMDDQA